MKNNDATPRPVWPEKLLPRANCSYTQAEFDAACNVALKYKEQADLAEKECGFLRNEIADLREAGNRLDGAIDMQLRRESGEFHITQQAAMAVVVEARLLWAKATPHIKDGEKR